jgi:ATP synthase F0 subunit b
MMNLRRIFGLPPWRILPRNMMKAQKMRLSTIVLVIAAFCMLSPQALWAAEGSEDGWGFWIYGFGRLLNLALVVGVVVWAARKPLSNFLISRSEGIRQQLAEAQKAKLEAEAKLAEMEARMSRLDGELEELKTAAEAEAKQEHARLVAEAERDADKIIERARQEIDGMTRAAHVELREHAAELSVQLAEKSIRNEITDEDRSRLFARFVAGLGEKS